MPAIHPTAVLDGEVSLADDVVVGPGCVLTGPVTIGAGSRLIGSAYLTGPLTLGRDNVVYPFTCLGFAPQHVKFDPNEPGRGLEIGEGNSFREHVTIHRAFADDGPTRIGNRNYFMATSHAGHDCRVGDDCTFVNGALLAGHVTVQDRVTIGGGTMVHQFTHIGRGAMLSGAMAVGLDVPPWFMLTGINICGAVNLIGLRRSGMERKQIDLVRWVHRILCRSGLSVKKAVEKIRERAGDPLIDEYIAFIESSERGICHGVGKTIRGTA
jgi:UDP-N-acetylglucosamine acyltransferase